MIPHSPGIERCRAGFERTLNYNRAPDPVTVIAVDKLPDYMGDTK